MALRKDLLEMEWWWDGDGEEVEHLKDAREARGRVDGLVLISKRGGTVGIGEQKHGR